MIALAKAVSVAFSQSLRSLDSDRARVAALFAFGFAVVLAAWLVWFWRADVAIYEVSDRARIEVESAAHSVDVAVSGRIASMHLEIGTEVKAGDVLVELDAELEKKQLVEEQARLATLEPQIEATRRALEAQGQVLRDDQRATVTALDEARARSREAFIAADQAADEATRGARLLDGGAIAEVEERRLRSEAERRRATTEALVLDVERTAGDQKKRASEGRTQVENMRRELAALEGLRATTLAAVDVLSARVDRRSIRAPVSGRIGDVAQHKVGTYVQEGEHLAAIVPEGILRMVGAFVPSSAVGRIRPGQPARMRLDGFPWAQYGTVTGTVTNVGTEVREGRVRVELAVTRDPHSLIPMQHGLPGALEVEVERVSPAVLVVRTLGRLLGEPARPGERG